MRVLRFSSRYCATLSSGHQQREEDHQAEAEVGDDLVVGLAVGPSPPLAPWPGAAGRESRSGRRARRGRLGSASRPDCTAGHRGRRRPRLVNARLQPGHRKATSRNLRTSIFRMRCRISRTRAPGFAIRTRGSVAARATLDRLGLNIPYEWWPARGHAEGDRGGRLPLGPGRHTAGRDARRPPPRRAPRDRAAPALEVTELCVGRARPDQPAARQRAPQPRVRGPARVRAADRRHACRLSRARLPPARDRLGRGGARAAAARP